MVSSIYNWLNRSIWLIDRTPTSTTTLGQSEPGSNGNEEVLSTPQSSRTGVLPSHGLESYSGHLYWRGSYSSAEMNWFILHPQLTVLNTWVICLQTCINANSSINVSKTFVLFFKFAFLYQGLCYFLDIISIRIQWHLNSSFYYSH